MDALANPQPPLPRDSGRRDQVVVLRGITWAEHVFGLVGRRYVARAKSEVLPRIDLARVAAIVRGADPSKQTEAVKAYRASLRRRR